MDMEASHSAINGLAEVSQPPKKTSVLGYLFSIFYQKFVIRCGLS
jgi:hypothetical protein